MNGEKVPSDYDDSSNYTEVGRKSANRLDCMIKERGKLMKKCDSMMVADSVPKPKRANRPKLIAPRPEYIGTSDILVPSPEKLPKVVVPMPEYVGRQNFVVTSPKSKIHPKTKKKADIFSRDASKRFDDLLNIKPKE